MGIIAAVLKRQGADVQPGEPTQLHLVDVQEPKVVQMSPTCLLVRVKVFKGASSSTRQKYSDKNSK